MRKILLTLLFALFSANSLALEIKNTTVKELEKTYAKYKYNDYIYMPDWKYPPIFLDKLPSDFDKIKDNDQRNRLFLMIVGPLALKLQEETSQERSEIIKINDKFDKKEDLNGKENNFLEEKAKKYDVFTRLKGLQRQAFLLKELVLRIDVVPPSILMAAAAIESDWGTSHPAKMANSLYKERVWYANEGLKPTDEPNADYRFKIFGSLYDSMQSYALKINSHVDYNTLRNARSAIRYREKPVFGRSLAYTMVIGSALENYAGLVDYTITFYELTNFDEASLAN